MNGGLKYPVRPSNFPELGLLSNPQSAKVPEAIPFVYYDTQDLASNWTSQSFFATPQTNKTLGNIEQGGQMPADTYFQIWSFNFDILISAAVQAATPTLVNDVLSILYGSRAALVLTIASKTYGPVPLTYLHSSGGARLNIAQSEAVLAGITQVAQTEAPDGGWWTDGAIVLTPGQSFSVQLIGTASSLNVTRAVRVSMAGVKYRPVR